MAGLPPSPHLEPQDRVADLPGDFVYCPCSVHYIAKCRDKVAEELVVRLNDRIHPLRQLVLRDVPALWHLFNPVEHLNKRISKRDRHLHFTSRKILRQGKLKA